MQSDVVFDFINILHFQFNRCSRKCIKPFLADNYHYKHSWGGGRMTVSSAHDQLVACDELTF